MESGRTAFAGACLLLFLLAAGATSVEYCDKSANYPVKVSGVQISPNPVARGEPTKFSISAASEGAISDGKLVIVVKYFGFYVHEETHNLCDDTSCPVTGGDFIISHEQTLPSYTPPGSYSLTMKLLGEDGRQLTCVNFDFSVDFFAEEVSDQ